MEPRGIEPRFTECDSVVIPLDHGPGVNFGGWILVGAAAWFKRGLKARAVCGTSDAMGPNRLISRRGFLAAATVAAPLFAFGSTTLVDRPPTIPGPVAKPKKPALKLPAGACDCHAHVFGPQAKFGYIPDAAYIPPDAPVDAYVRLLKHLGCSRAVLVQPSVYGADHAAMLEAMGSGKFDFRGVAVVRRDVTFAEIEKLHAAGFRGIRINGLSKNAGLPLEIAPKLAEMIKPLGWHLQFFLSVEKLVDAGERLGKLPVNVVIDHFGAFDGSKGVGGEGFRRLLKLMARENVWVKLSGVYQVFKKPVTAAEVKPFVERMMEVCTERLVWGTDWPHPTAAWIPDDGELVDMLGSWVPDEPVRERILVGNPQRLYGFGKA
jgi:2-pyrone-4,6-dicarboxylate lactonase